MTAQEKFDLAYKYLTGDGVAVDVAKAAGLFEEAAEAGIAGALYYLAMIIQGFDPQGAIELYEKYLDKRPDDSDALFALGALYCDWKKPQQWNPEKGQRFLERFEIIKDKNGGVKKLPFYTCMELGEIYANSGLVRVRENYGKHDIKYIRKAKEYLEEAVAKGKENPNVPPELLSLLEEQLSNQISRIEAHDAIVQGFNELQHGLNKIIR